MVSVMGYSLDMSTVDIIATQRFNKSSVYIYQAPGHEMLYDYDSMHS